MRVSFHLLWQFVLDLFKFNSQQREALSDVVVQISGNAGAFLLLCFNQPSVHAREYLFRLLASRDVTNDLGGTDDPALRIPNRRDSNGNVESVAILRQADGLEVRDPLTIGKPAQYGPMFLLQFRRNEYADWLTDNFSFRV